MEAEANGPPETNDNREAPQHEEYACADVGRHAAQQISLAEEAARQALVERDMLHEAAVAEAKARVRFFAWMALAAALFGAVVGAVSIGFFWRLVVSRRSGGQPIPSEGAADGQDACDRLVKDIEVGQAPALVFEGIASDGRRVAAKLPAAAFLLTRDGATIGRNPDGVDLLLDDDTVSRLHARVRFDDDRVMIEDLDSSGGTSINGVALVPGDPRVLRHGDALAIGGLVTTVRMVQ